MVVEVWLVVFVFQPYKKLGMIGDDELGCLEWV
jgi:hypothetical protein